MKKIILLLLISASAAHMQAQKSATPAKEPKVFHAFNASYLISTNGKNTDAKKPLFAGNGFAVSYRPGVALAKNFALAADIGFQTGSTNTKEIDAYAKVKVPNPYTYKTEVSNKNWSSFIVAAGPVVSVPRLIFSVNAGVQMSQARSITITKYDGQTMTGSIFNQKQASSSFYWGANMEVLALAVKSKNLPHPHISFALMLTGGISSNGASLGITIRRKEPPRYIPMPHCPCTICGCK
jgi:hypothetical protein